MMAESASRGLDIGRAWSERHRLPDLQVIAERGRRNLERLSRLPEYVFGAIDPQTLLELGMKGVGLAEWAGVAGLTVAGAVVMVVMEPVGNFMAGATEGVVDFAGNVDESEREYESRVREWGHRAGDLVTKMSVAAVVPQALTVNRMVDFGVSLARGLGVGLGSLGSGLTGRLFNERGVRWANENDVMGAGLAAQVSLARDAGGEVMGEMVELTARTIELRGGLGKLANGLALGAARKRSSAVDIRRDDLKRAARWAANRDEWRRVVRRAVPEPLEGVFTGRGEVASLEDDGQTTSLKKMKKKMAGYRKQGKNENDLVAALAGGELSQFVSKALGDGVVDEGEALELLRIAGSRFGMGHRGGFGAAIAERAKMAAEAENYRRQVFSEARRGSRQPSQGELSRYNDLRGEFGQGAVRWDDFVQSFGKYKTSFSRGSS